MHRFKRFKKLLGIVIFNKQTGIHAALVEDSFLP